MIGHYKGMWHLAGARFPPSQSRLTTSVASVKFFLFLQRSLAGIYLLTKVLYQLLIWSKS